MHSKPEFLKSFDSKEINRFLSLLPSESIVKAFHDKDLKPFIREREEFFHEHDYQKRVRILRGKVF